MQDVKSKLLLRYFRHNDTIYCVIVTNRYF